MPERVASWWRHSASARPLLGRMRARPVLGCSATRERRREPGPPRCRHAGAGATVGARQRLRPRRGNTQVTRGVRRDQPAARRAASAAARQAGRARARPTAAADGAVTRGRRTAIVALPHSTFWLLSRSIQEIVRQIFTPHTTTLSVQFFFASATVVSGPCNCNVTTTVRPWTVVFGASGSASLTCVPAHTHSAPICCTRPLTRALKCSFPLSSLCPPPD